MKEKNQNWYCFHDKWGNMFADVQAGNVRGAIAKINKRADLKYKIVRRAEKIRGKWCTDYWYCFGSYDGSPAFRVLISRWDKSYKEFCEEYSADADL